MFTKRHLIALVVLAAFIGIFALLKLRVRKENNNGITIGILQTASHPALDAVREGFMQEIKNDLPDVEFVVQNAQGNINNAHAIAQSFHANDHINAIFAIATPALQATASIEKQKPIVFAAVTDPKALHLELQNSNITGVSDMINVPNTITMLKELVPTAKTVALIYNNAEINSATLAKSMKKELEAQGLQAIDFGVTSEADILPAVTTALSKADALLAPTDNTVASTIELIAKQALAAKKPLLVSDNLLVAKGALAARGVDYKAIGQQAAQQMSAILKDGKKPYELPIGYAISGRIFINKQTLENLNLHIPASLEDQVTFI